MRLIKTILVTVWIIILSCSKTQTINAPEKLGTLPLSQKVTGDEADLIVTRLHIGKVTPGENTVAYYEGNGKMATLYISTYGSPNEADSLLNRMSNKIGKGNYGFWHHVKFNIKEDVIHLTMGQGQLHYFFTRGNQVVWLASPVDEGNAMLAQLLNINQEEINQAIRKAIQKEGESNEG